MNNEINYECGFLHTYDDMRNYESECTFPLSEFKDCNKNNCVFKQLLAEQAKNKKLIEALEKIENCWNNIDSDKFAGNRIYIILQQALNEVNK